MNPIETRQERVARLLAMRESMSVKEIAAAEGRSRQEIHRLIGPTRRTNHALLLSVHAFIQGYERQHRIGPSIPEIAAQFPTTEGKPRSTSLVRYWLCQMEKLKWIRPRTPGVARSLRTRPLPKPQP